MSFPFDSKSGAIYVQGEVTGPARTASVRLILDTGATMSLINSRVLIGLGFDPKTSAGRIGEADVVTGSRIERASKLMLTRLTVLGQHRFGFPVVAHDLPPSAAIDGLLGLDFFRDQALTIDFRTGRITLA